MWSNVCRLPGVPVVDLRSLVARVPVPALLVAALVSAIPARALAAPTPGVEPPHLVGRTVQVTGPRGNERRFVVERVLGRGLNGTTVAASDGRARVAVKIANLGPRAETVRNGFVREAAKLRAVAGAHPGVLATFGEGIGHLVRPDGRRGARVVVLQVAQGEPLGVQTVGNGQRAFDSDRVPRDPKLAARIALRATNIVAAVHARGYVHGDVHPGNLRMSGDDPSTLTLLDFGAARPLGGKVTGARDLVDVGRLLTYLTTRGNAMRESTIDEMPDVRREVGGRTVTLADVARRAQSGGFADAAELRRALVPFTR